PRACELTGERVGLGLAELLPRAVLDRPRVGHERRVVRVDRVERAGKRLLGVDHLGAEFGELGREGLVLGGEPGWIGLRAPAELPPAGAVLGPGGAYEHAAQSRRLALASVELRLGDGHRPSLVSR